MTHVDFADITIKTEPLSPDSIQQVMADTTQTFYDIQSAQQQQPTISTPPTHSPFSNTTCQGLGSSKEYSSIHTSPNFGGGIVKTIPKIEPDTGIHSRPNTFSCGIVKTIQSGPLTTSTTPVNTVNNTKTNLNTNNTRIALKSSILNKRKARGETMPLSSTDDAPREYKLTKREIERKEARKEQNRRAARKCRMKKKRIQVQAGQEMQMAIKENVDMKNEVQNLRLQISRLEQIISEHKQNEDCKLPVCLPTVCRGGSHTTHSKTRKRNIKSQTSLLHVDTKPTQLSTPFQQHSPISSDNLHNQDVYMAPSKCPEIMPYPHEFMGSNNNNNNAMSNCTAATTNNMNKNTINSFQTPSSNSIITPTNWELNNIATDELHPDQEVSEDISEFIKLLENNPALLESLEETPKLDEEHMINPHKNNDTNKLVFSCPKEVDTPTLENSTVNQLMTPSSKPPVVRNLNKYFGQNEICSNGQQPQPFKRANIPPPLSLKIQEDTKTSSCQDKDTASQACRFLLDSNLTSPILSCVPPNLVQEPLMPVNSTCNNINKTSNTTSPCTTQQQQQYPALNNNYHNNTPFETQAILQHSNSSLFHPEHQIDNHHHHNHHHQDLNEIIPFDGMTPSFDVNNINNNQNNNSPSFLPYTSCQIPPPGATMTEFCSSNTTTTNSSSTNINDHSDILSSLTTTTTTTNNYPGGFGYQLSPISSNPSPSSVSTLSSPGFLHPTSPHDMCPNNNNSININTNDNNNNTVTAFEFDLLS